MSRIRFGKYETICLLVNLISTQTFLGFPRTMVEIAGTAGWILVIYVYVLTLILFLFISKLYSHFEGKDLLDIAEIAGGGVARVVVGSIIVAYLVFAVSIILREFSENMKVISYDASPVSYISLFFLSGMVISAYIGLEALMRYSGIAVPIIVTGLIAIFIGVSPFIDLENLMPILGNGLYDIFVKGVLRVSTFSPLIILYLFNPFIGSNRNFRQAGVYGISIAFVLMLLCTSIYLSVYPYPFSLQSFLPVHTMARTISLGRFFQRLESVFMFIWVTNALIYLSSGFFLINYVFKKTFNLVYYKPLIIPFAIIILSISLLPDNLMSVLKLVNDYFRSYVWITTFPIPILVLIAARYRVRGKKGVKAR